MIQITTQSKEPPQGVFKSELAIARGVRDGKIKLPRLAVLYELPNHLAKDGGWKKAQATGRWSTRTWAARSTNSSSKTRWSRPSAIRTPKKPWRCWPASTSTSRSARACSSTAGPAPTTGKAPPTRS
jgi:hypothetical protein